MKRMTVHTAEHREMVTLLFDLRRQADMTQTDAAEALGRPQTYISAVEVGRRGVDLVQVREFCLIYGVSFPKFAEMFERRMKSKASHQRPPRLTTRPRETARHKPKSRR